MHKTIRIGTALALAALAAGCSRKGEIDPAGGVIQVRSACPRAGIPAQTGDVTLFNPAGSTDSRAIDVVGIISNLKVTCSEAGAQFYTEASFDVSATRPNAGPAREVVLPYFSAIVRGGTSVVAKRVGQVRLSFADGERRARASATASSYVDRSVASLPPEIEEEIRRNRKPGDEDAATDPLSRPDVRAAIARTSFELFVGFNLTQDQLRYNATR